MTVVLENLADGSVSDRNFQTLAQTVNPPLPQARVYNSASISVANNTGVILTFNSERWDEGALHDTGSNTGRLTAPIAGLYEIGCNVRFASSATGVRQTALRINGATFIAADMRGAVSGDVTDVAVTTLYRLAATDYVEVQVFQTSGGALNVTAAGNTSPEFWMVRLGGYTNMGV